MMDITADGKKIASGGTNGKRDAVGRERNATTEGIYINWRKRSVKKMEVAKGRCKGKELAPHGQKGGRIGGLDLQVVARTMCPALYYLQFSLRVDKAEHRGWIRKS